MKIATLCETHNVGMIPHGTGPISVAALTHTERSPDPYAWSAEVFPSPYICPKAPISATANCDPAKPRGWEPNSHPKGADLISEITERSAPIPIYRRPDGSMTNW